LSHKNKAQEQANDDERRKHARLEASCVHESTLELSSAELAEQLRNLEELRICMDRDAEQLRQLLSEQRAELDREREALERERVRLDLERVRSAHHQRSAKRQQQKQHFDSLLSVSATSSAPATALAHRPLAPEVSTPAIEASVSVNLNGTAPTPASPSSLRRDTPLRLVSSRSCTVPPVGVDIASSQDPLMELFDLPTRQQVSDLEARVSRIEESLTALMDPALVRRQRLRQSTSLSFSDAGSRESTGSQPSNRDIHHSSSSSSSSSSNPSFFFAAHLTPLSGLCAGAPKDRAHFLQSQWLPFIRELRQALLEVQTKSLHSYAPHERMPSQQQIAEWSDRCRKLTEQWYGSGLGSLSAMYEFLMEAANYSGESGYRFEAIPTKRSADGYVRVIDGEIRRELYDKGQLARAGKQSEALSVFDMEGNVIQQQGASPIDNTVLPNVLRPFESKVLLAGGLIKDVFMRIITQRQRDYLLRIGKRLGVDLFQRDPDYVRAVLTRQQQLNDGALFRELEIDQTNFSFRTLLHTGHVVQSWGQLQGEDRENAHRFLLQRLKSAGQRASEPSESFQKTGGSATSSSSAERRSTRSQSNSSGSASSGGGSGGSGSSSGSSSCSGSSGSGSSCGSCSSSSSSSSSPNDPAPKDAIVGQKEIDEDTLDSPSQLLEEFIQFTKANPGKIFRQDKQLHKKLLVLGLWQNELSVAKRSALEKHTVHRHLLFEWTRQVPLVQLQEDGTESTLRLAGATEHSRFRKNGFPYQDAHGMGLSSGGLEESTNGQRTLAYEYGNALPRDARAKLSNWYATDIEKILQEVSILNPRGSLAEILPGEAFHDVGQNPQISSSIGATQHTQISRSSVRVWPLFALENKPTWHEELRAYLDVVQVGASSDAFFVKIRTQYPNSVEIVGLLQDLRLELLRKLGGREVDFNVIAMPDEQGWFIITFAPLAMLYRENIPDDSPIAHNPCTKESSQELVLPYMALDSSSGKGNFCLSSATRWQLALEGKGMLERLYDFCRRPGARHVTRNFLLDRFAFVDRCGTVNGPSPVAVEEDNQSDVFCTLASSCTTMAPCLKLNTNL